MKNLAKFRYALIGLAILVCLAALYFFLGFGVRFTKNEPKESDVVGIYRPDPKTLILIKNGSDFPATNSEIKLDADGKIELVNVLGWLQESNTNMAGVRLLSANGTWHLGKMDDHWQIVSEYEEFDRATIYLQLVGEKPPYEIRIYNWQTRAPFYFVQDRN